MHLGNLFEAIVHHLLIGGIVSLGRQDEVPMVSALVCIDYYQKVLFCRPNYNVFKHL